MLYVKPTGGLGNYLRVIFSWLKRARAEQQGLTVVWERTTACNGYYEELFEPVRDLTIVHWTTKPLNYEGCDPCGDYSLVRELTLKVASIETRAAIHVRGTDFGSPQYEPFEQFIESCEDPVFLATDDVVTQRHFMTKYPGRIKIHAEITGKGLRQTTLKVAAIDLFTCAKADKFLGTKNSSFTDIIELLRGN
jgi:hypothetical protein